MKKILLVLSMVILIAVPAFAKDYIKATDIQKISLGDTFEQVTERIGEPQQVLSKELTADSKEQVVWLYETTKSFEEERTLFQFGGIAPKGNFSKLKSYQQNRIQNPPYLVIFINGKVSKIKRQEIDPDTNKPVDVVVY